MKKVGMIVLEVWQKIKYIIISLIVLTIISVVALSSFVLYNMNTDLIQSNVFIDNIDVSGLTKPQAVQKITTLKTLDELSLRYGKNTWDIPASDFDFVYNIEDSVNKAYLVARSNDFFENYFDIIFLKLGERKDIELTNSYDMSKIEKFVDKIAKELNSKPVEAKITAEKGNVNVIAGRDGKTLQKDTLMKEIEVAFDDSLSSVVEVDIPFAVKSPKLKYSTLKNINGLIASYETRYSTLEYERSHNIENAANILDKQLLMPGQEVSFMKSVGDISWYNGFMMANVIVNNKYEQGMGGGICQVSTTLYNALIESGVEIKERKNHSLPVKYVPLGRDATVATNSPDLKYINNYDFPIYIRNYASNGVMKSEIYGDTTKAQKVQIYTQYVGGRVVTYKVENGKSVILSSDVYSRPSV